VAYLNTDVAVSGRIQRLVSTELKEFIRQIARDVPSPAGGTSTAPGGRDLWKGAILQTDPSNYSSPIQQFKPERRFRVTR